MQLPAIISTGSAALALVLSVLVFFSSSSNNKLQEELQKRQQTVQTEQQSVQLQQQQLQEQQRQIDDGIKLHQQLGPAVLRDLGTVAVNKKNEKIRKLLEKHGLKIEEKPADPATPTTTPKPNP